MIKKQWQLAIDYLEQFAGEVQGDNYSDIVWGETTFTEQELIDKYNEIKRDQLSWVEMIKKRNQLLAETDWRFRSDLTPSQEWIDYCQELRDITCDSSR